MDRENLARLSYLLEQVLDRPAAERLEFVDSLSDEDDTFKPHLRRALSDRTDGGPSLESLPQFDTVSHVTAEDDGTRLAQVGPYRIIRKLGDGGMGSVWLAERADGMLKRPIALKLPRGFWLDPDLAGRLARERELLAALNHPHIARLYDAGVTSDGVPYIALEYVEGQAIDGYCREASLDGARRLQLFLQVLRAVAHAHNRLIVHRDLKPSNILVTSDGAVKLLDFGIGKLLDEGGRETALTRDAGRPLTPEYASPEQRAGELLTVATDIYSLGVLLYELLTGERPYTSEEIRAAAAPTRDPRPPSSVVESPGARRFLRGDLDTVVLKALKHAPSDRYLTVEAFASDIERFRDGRPVLAQPDTAGYRVRKFAARHRYALAAAALVLTAIVMGAGIAVWQAQVAIAERARAEEIKDFTVGIFRDADPFATAGRTLTGVEILQQARGRVDRELAGRPDLQMEILNIIGTSFIGLQDFQAAEEVFVKALAGPAQLLPGDDSRVVYLRTRLADAYRMLGKQPQVAAELETLDALVAANPAALSAELPTIHRIRAHLAIDQGRYAEAQASAELAHAGILAQYGAEHQLAVETALLRAVSLQYGSNPSAALHAAEEGYRIALTHYANNDGHPRVIDARLIYGRALGNHGELEAAISHLTAGRDRAIALYGENAPMVGFMSADLSRYQGDLGDITGALANAEQTVSIFRESVQQDSFTAAAASYRLGFVRLAARQPAQAIAPLEIAAQSLARTIGAEHERTLLARVHLALAYAQEGRLTDAQRTLPPLASVPEDAAPTLAVDVRRVAGTVDRLSGRPAMAVAMQQAALDAIDRGRPDDRARMRTLGELGLSQLAAGHSQAAATTLERAAELFGRLQPHLAPEHVDVLAGLGQAYVVQGRPTEALPLLERATHFWQAFDPLNPAGAEPYALLARCYTVLNRHADAAAALERSRRASATATRAQK